MKLNSESLLSFGVFGLGLVAIGYAIGVHSKMKTVAEKLDTSIDKIANDAEIEISSKVIDQAVQASYDVIADDVTSEIAKNVAKIDEDRLKRDVVAKDKLDGLLEEFNGNLQNVSRIYKSIAKSFSKEDLLS